MTRSKCKANAEAQLFLHHKGVDLYYVRKNGGRLQYWFSLWPGAVEGGGDPRYAARPWIDARELPGATLPMLQTRATTEVFAASMLAEEEAMRARFRKAIDAGIDLIEWAVLHDKINRLRSIAESHRYAAMRSAISDDLPF